jgi:hypothetical protein
MQKINVLGRHNFVFLEKENFNKTKEKDISIMNDKNEI